MGIFKGQHYWVTNVLYELKREVLNNEHFYKRSDESEIIQ